MRFDRRFLIVVGCSLLWSLLVATIFYRVAAKAGTRRAAEQTRPLVVAARPLPLGDVISADSIRLAEVPESLFPKSGFSKKEDVLGRPVVSRIEADEPLLDSRLAAKGSGVGLAPMIPPGMRAAAVRVNDVVGVAGFVLPGMRVDVLVTGHPSGRDDTVTNTVLQNIAVLSAGTTIQPDAKGQPISATVVTLLVDLEQAQALTLANTEGRIQLVLRNGTDQKVTPTRGQQLRELYGVDRSPVPAAAPAPSASAPARRKPEIVRAAEPAAAPVVIQAADEIVIIRGNLKTVERPGKGDTK
jgi:pilus assembly protein CpaB